jgi:hypothetical protein
MSRIRKQPISTNRPFQKAKTYVFGPLKSGADPASMNPDFRILPASYTGAYFNARGCRTVADFCFKNPEGLPPRALYFYEVQPDGSRVYFGEGTPARSPKALVAAGLSDDVTVGSSLPRPFMTEQNYDRQPAEKSDYQAYLERRVGELERQLSEKDGMIYGLQQRAHDAEIAATKFERLYEAEKKQREMEREIAKATIKSEIADYLEKKKGGSGGGLSGIGASDLIGMFSMLMSQKKGGNSGPGLSGMPGMVPRPPGPRPQQPGPDGRPGNVIQMPPMSNDGFAPVEEV